MAKRKWICNYIYEAIAFIPNVIVITLSRCCTQSVLGQTPPRRHHKLRWGNKDIKKTNANELSEHFPSRILISLTTLKFHVWQSTERESHSLETTLIPSSDRSTRNCWAFIPLRRSPIALLWFRKWRIHSDIFGWLSSTEQYSSPPPPYQ